MNPASKLRRLDFIGRPAPPGYVAGIGRGATGFTTRSDIGPAREAAAAAALAANAASSSRGDTNSSQEDGPPRKLVKRANNSQNDDDGEDEYLNESNYDDFAGYGGSLVNKDPYEEDDEEADKIYDAIDKHLDERGKALREAKRRQEREKYRQERPKIQQQFSDLKQSLAEVSEAEWYNIPEVGDARNRKQRVARQDKFMPIPDSLLAHQMRVATGGERVVYIDPNAMETDDNDGDDGNAGDNRDANDEKTLQSAAAKTSNSSIGLNIGEMSDLRSSYMSARLSRASTSANSSAAATVDPQEYLSKFDSWTPTQITEEQTLKEFRKQYASLRQANPQLSNVWIASVRLEEAAGKLSTARALIREGCKKCPKSVDLWLEAVRIFPPDVAQRLMAQALKENPRSERLWIRAANLQQDPHSKRKVYEKAREMCPKSAWIWKKSVELEARSPDEAAKILREAIECCPESVELYLALARLVSYEEAKQILSKASERHPASRAVWIMKAKLEEAKGHEELVGGIIKAAIDEISKTEPINRDEWLAEAADAEKARFRTTCHEVIKRVIGLSRQETAAASSVAAALAEAGDEKKMKTTAGIVVKVERVAAPNRSAPVQQQQQRADDQRRKLETLMEDIRKFVAAGSLECARAVYEFIVTPTVGNDSRIYRQVESNWISYAEFEQKHGTSDRLESILRRAVQGENCPKSERLWLMLARAHKEQSSQASGSLHETRQILSDALDANPDSEKIILEAVELECENGNCKEARRILADACMSSKTPELVRRAAKLEWALGNLDESIRMLKAGTNEYKDYAEFYLMLGQIEEQRGNVQQAKTHYSDGLKYQPTSVELWMSLARAEEKTGSYGRARSKLELARLRNPRCPQLWLESARFEIRVHETTSADKGVVRTATLRPDIVNSILAKGLRECKDCPDVDILKAEQEAFNKRKFV